MKVKGKIIFEYKNPEDAKISYNTLKIDNDENYIKSSIKNKKTIYELKNPNLGSFLNSADDLIFSEILIEKILDKTTEKK